MAVVLVAYVFVLAACARAWGEQGDYYESFENGVPPTFTATRSESLSLSPWHYKQGSHSLRWDWYGGEELLIRHGIGDVGRTNGTGARAGFSAWLYVEEAMSDALVFEFRQGEVVTGFFRFPLAFTGWRQARPHFQDFPHGQPTPEVDNIRIAAPSGAARGTVFLDFIKYNTLTLGRYSVIPEEEARWRRPEPDERRFPRPKRVTEAERTGIRKLLGPDRGTGIEQATVDDLCGRVEALCIVRDTHGIRGPGIDAFYQFFASAEEQAAQGWKGGGYWSDEHGPGWMGMQTPHAMCSLARSIAGAYRDSNDAEQRRRLADAFLIIADHLEDQAMQAGSGFRWYWWVGGAWSEAVFLMRDVLADTGRLQGHLDFQLYAYDSGAIFAEGDAPSNMDFYHLTVPCMLRHCLMQVEEADQVRWLTAFRDMLERSMLQPASALKIDGSAYHHSGHYHSYASNAFGTLPPLLRDLKDTPWRLKAEAHERLRRAMLAQQIYASRVDLPISLTGRSPFRGTHGFIRPRALEGLDILARCGTPDGTHGIDPEVAAAYLRLVPEAVHEEPYRSLGVEPEAEPDGTFVMPYAGLLCHRRDNWLVSVKGQSKYIWGTERQDHHNRFGLFQGLGHLEILAGGTPVTAKGSGRQHEGWDWARYEGTTAPHVPLEMLEEGGRTGGRVYSFETFVGGLSHQRRQGLFAMVVNQAMPGGRTLTGRKSWLFSDAQVVCLGSDIACNEAEYPTQTTLCQKALQADEGGGLLATVLDGEGLTAFPDERRLDQAKAHWFLDAQQTGYVLPAGQDAVVARKHQTSRDSWDQEDTEGDFLTAWIDHGAAPSSASYEYMLVVRATPEAMQKHALDPPYHIFQCDQAAHIVWHNEGRRWGCAFFVPQEVAAHTVATETVPVRSVDRPCLVMVEALRDEQLNLSTADPDLNLNPEEEGSQSGGAPRPPRPLRIALRGAWRLLRASATVCAWELPDVEGDVRVLSSNADETVLEVLCRHGASYDLTLAV